MPVFQVNYCQLQLCFLRWRQQFLFLHTDFPCYPLPVCVHDGRKIQAAKIFKAVRNYIQFAGNGHIEGHPYFVNGMVSVEPDNMLL